MDFEPNSVNLTVKDLVQGKTISSPEIVLTASSLFLSQRQDILNNLLARIAFTANQERTMETRAEVFSTVGAEFIDTRGNQLSDPEDIEIYREDFDLNMDAVFRPGINTSFSPSTIDFLRWFELLKTRF